MTQAPVQWRKTFSSGDKLAGCYSLKENFALRGRRCGLARSRRRVKQRFKHFISCPIQWSPTRGRCRKSSRRSNATVRLSIRASPRARFDRRKKTGRSITMEFTVDGETVASLRQEKKKRAHLTFPRSAPWSCNSADSRGRAQN